MNLILAKTVALVLPMLLAASPVFAAPEDVGARMAEARSAANGAPPEKRAQALLRLAAAERLRGTGRDEDVRALIEGDVRGSMLLVPVGELGLALETTGDGVDLLAVVDLAHGNDLLAEAPLPLFRLTLRRIGKEGDVRLAATDGWEEVTARKTPAGFLVRWAGRSERGPERLRVELKAFADEEASAVRWNMKAENDSEEWTLWRARFPQFALRRPGDAPNLLIPRGPGEVQGNVWGTDFQYGGTYPGGWMAPMPFMAAYDEQGGSGLYIAIHDPHGATKDLAASSTPDRPRVILTWDVPVPNMSRAGNDYELPGQAVWKLMRGDWYDAAVFYRDFVRAEADWFPKLTHQGRADSPRWLRELCAWTIGGGGMGPANLADSLGLPVGHHWYGWHSIPFDNDYPHYFPPEEGFRENVETLQDNAVHVMPYMNGRLWDTLDKEQEDWQFTKVALPAATKGPDGEPYTEQYGGKYEDGTPIRLAPMCATRELWQQKVKSIVLRLLKHYGTHAVYLDQVAAAAPPLCFDADHGHPLGGGHWWVEGYREMIEGIRQQMPEDRVLTTECNGEVFVDLFDAYLTWHWQYEGMVPAFPVIYGGAIQMFGRAYRGGPTKDLANRMKIGQELVFGEQIGWLGPNIANDKVNGPLFRSAVRLRHHLRRYFYAGEMARPLKPGGKIPRVTADWQWRGEWPVTLSAVQTGTWRLPEDGKVVFLFANVGMEDVEAEIAFDAADYGLDANRLRRTVVTAEGRGEIEQVGRTLKETLNLPAGTVTAWELQARQ